MTSLEKMNKGMSLVAEGIVETVNSLAKVITKIWEDVKPTLFPLLQFQNKKLTKKKFMKLLQSEGIQRNQINKIIANNKEPYTYKRLYETLNLLK